MSPLNRRSFLLSSLAVPFAGRIASAEQPAGFPGLIVRNSEPRNLEFPVSALDQHYVPNEQFFVRSHFAVPAVDVKAWTLSVSGAVNQPKEFTYADLLKLPAKTAPATIECAGNGRVFLNPAVPGLQWGQGGVGNAEWTGVPLSAILDAAGLKDAAVEVILEGADSGAINTDPKSPGPISFARSLPLDKAKRPEVLLAYKMNGEELPVAHGFPLRAVVSGWYGMASVKWLSKIIVTAEPFKGFFQTMDYSYWVRQDGRPTLRPVTEMLPKAIIARPGLNEVILAGKKARVFGAAWAGENAVERVEVSVDGGKVWSAATLTDKAKPFEWVFWEWTWEDPAKGPQNILVRAKDTKGRTQPATRDIDRRSTQINHLVPFAVTVK